MKILTTLKKRWRAKTPKIFKVIRDISLSIAVSAGAATVTYAGFDESLKDLIPVGLIKGIGIAALVATIVSQLTKEKDGKESSSN